MSRPPTTWKKVELEIARYLGGQRRGADFSERDSTNTGKDDVIDIPGWAIEIKHDKDASYGLACAALDQVDLVYGVATNEAVPVAIIHRKGLRRIEQSVACFRPKVWYELFKGKGVSYYRPIYTSTRPLWKNIVKEVTTKHKTADVKALFVQKVTIENGLPSDKDYSPFIACSLPNFKEFILPLHP